jgi:hypothetical protein
MRGLWFLFKVLLLGWLIVLAGCDSVGAEQGASGSTTASSTGGGGGAGGTSGTSGPGGGPICAGVCKESGPLLFKGPTMLWLGPSEDALSCPDVAPLVGAELFAEPIAPFTCPSCSCAPAGCVLPEHMHVSAAKCSDGEPASVVWDSPAWEGSSPAEGAIAPGMMCGGEPCTQSLTIEAASVGPCQPVSEGAEDVPDPAWGLLAHECILGPLTGEGCITGEVCVPAPPAGFTLCVHRKGDDPRVPCPNAYPHRYVVYEGKEDDRSCASCSCGDPQGAACSALVKAFTDGACGAQIASATVSPGSPACADLPPGSGLGSKAATWTEQTPGSCTPSGGPVGGLVLKLPYTLCCETEANKPK